MTAIPAVYENGLFRPIDPVRLDEGTRVSVVVQPAELTAAEPEPTPEQIEARREVYEILSHRYSSGHHDTAERPDEAAVVEQVDRLRETDPGLAAVYEVLSHRYNSGHHDTAERHNEHQP